MACWRWPMESACCSWTARPCSYRNSRTRIPPGLPSSCRHSLISSTSWATSEEACPKAASYSEIGYNKSVYGVISAGRIQGQLLVIDWKAGKAKIWIETGSSSQKLETALKGEWSGLRGGIDRQSYRSTYRQSQIVKKISPFTQSFPSLHKYILHNFPKLSLGGEKKQGVMMQMRLSSSLTFNHLPHLFLLYNAQTSQLSAFGVSENGKMNGIGWKRVHEDYAVDGQFKEDVFQGYGYRYKDDKFTFGRWQGNDVKDVHVVTDNYQLVSESSKAFKKNIHIHSLDFENDYFSERGINIIRNLIGDIHNKWQESEEPRSSKNWQTHSYNTINTNSISLNSTKPRVSKEGYSSNLQASSELREALQRYQEIESQLRNVSKK